MADRIGARRPLRTAGFALLGLSAVATLVGLLFVFTGDESDLTAGQPVASPVPSDPNSPSNPSDQSVAPPPGAPTVSAPASPPPAGPPPAGPPPATSAPASPAPPGAWPADPGAAGPGAGSAGLGSAASAGTQPQSRGELRVYNNSTIHGLATRAADELAAAGWTVVEVGNYSGGRIWTTTVYYQDDGTQRAVAEEVGAQFGMRVEPRFAGIEDATPGVIVIVTNDYGT